MTAKYSIRIFHKMSFDKERVLYFFGTVKCSVVGVEELRLINRQLGNSHCKNADPNIADRGLKNKPSETETKMFLASIECIM